MNDTENTTEEIVEAPTPPPVPERRFTAFILTFIIMAIMWVILSGQFDAFHLTLGVICCAVVAFTSSDLLFKRGQKARITIHWFRYTLYIPWLLWEIFKANLWLMYLAFHPNLQKKIRPRIITFHSRLKSDFALLTFANSITLTPGTITVRMDPEGNFEVHAIDEKSAAALPGAMQERIAKVYGE